MIEIIPAIDLMNGQFVRLQKGDKETKIVISDDPVGVAQSYEKLGFKRLHLVDLDAAINGIFSSVNQQIIKKMSETTNLKIDYGGGIRTLDQAETILNRGVDQVNLGTLSVENPRLAYKMIERFAPARIIIAADVKNRTIMTRGWNNSSHLKIDEVLTYYSGLGIHNFIVTDTERDGMMNGPSLELYISLYNKFPDLNIIASGGVANTNDIVELNNYGVKNVIVGKALAKNDSLKNMLHALNKELI